MSDEYWNESRQENDDDFLDENNGGFEKDAIVFIVEITESFFNLMTSASTNIQLNLPAGVNPNAVTSKSERPLMRLLEAIYSCIFQRLLVSRDSMASIIFVNGSGSIIPEEQSDQIEEYCGTAMKRSQCHVFMDLDIPSVSKLRDLKLLATLDEEFRRICTPLELVNDSNELDYSNSAGGLANAFYVANKMLGQKHLKTYQSKRVVFITDKDTPKNASAQRLAIRTRIKDLSASGVELVPFFVIPNETTQLGLKEFDPLLFYEDILLLSTTKELDPSVLLPHSAKDVRVLTEEFTNLGTPKRAMFTNKIQLTSKLNIGVKAYAIIAQKRFPHSVSVCKREITTTTTTKQTTMDGIITETQTFENSIERDISTSRQLYYSSETGGEIEKSQILRAYKFGTEYIPMSDKQLSEIRYFGEPIIRVLGFKDPEAVGWEYAIKKSIFLYPTDELYIGSKRAFTALYRSMITQKKVAMVWTILRKGSQPRIGALIPFHPSEDPFNQEAILKQYEKNKGLSNVSGISENFPMGMHFVPLAFSDELRDPPPDPPDVPTKDPPRFLIESMMRIFDRLPMNIGYVPRRYPNMGLSKFYSALQATVFEEEHIDDPDSEKNDPTLPKYRSIQSRAYKSIMEFNELLDGHMLIKPMQAPVMNKRGSSSTVDSPNKKARVEPDGSIKTHVLYDRLKDAAISNDYESFNVDQLKDFISAARIKTQAKSKQWLASAITRYFNSSM